jgi:hypothetical protein
VSEILGKVTGVIDVARGADVSLRIVVPRLWLLEGRSIEVELPRNLVCAQCSGGGCSRCQNSGAISVRGRNELPEVVQVCLPEQRDDVTRRTMQEMESRYGNIGSPDSKTPLKTRSIRPMTIRIPECGGLPESGSTTIVRGWLLLHVGIAEQPSANVHLLDEDEPLSSSKMVRAEVKSRDGLDGETPAPDEATDAATNFDAEALPQPSTRVAKVRSVRISDPKSLRRTSERVEPSLVTVGPAESEWLGRTRWLWAVVIGAIIGVISALWLWSDR